MPQLKQVGWTAFCEKTGGRILEYSEERAKEQGRALYGEHGFKVAPLYITEHGVQIFEAK